MHPILRSRVRLRLYLSGWILVGIIIALLLVVLNGRAPMPAVWFALPLTVVYGFACLSAWWVCNANPLRTTSATRLLGVLLGTALLDSLLWALLGGAWSVAVVRLMPAFGSLATATFWHSSMQTGSGPDYESHRLARDLAMLITLGVPLFLLSAMLHYLLIAFEDSRQAERRALEAQVTAREAELRALRAQLNPHFLFNSLNSINALVGNDPEGARRMCEGLGDFLRRTLNLGAREAVTLSEELALVDRYLAIEQVRFGDRLAIERVIEPGAAECRVPPLLLQPLVENAVKHGVSARVEGGTVRIEARVRGEWLMLAIENPIDEQGPARVGEGVGLENVRRRLTVLGGRDARLEVLRASGRYRVELTLRAEAAEPSLAAPSLAPRPAVAS
ncbi:MAG TPA: histidine kinase [Candidatus Sulfotelmatobacter sp.]|nr:histidine kinase [Candidatus Sulfotelmatobacter sp.]